MSANLPDPLAVSSIGTTVTIDGKQVTLGAPDPLGMSSTDLTAYAVNLPGARDKATQLSYITQLSISSHRDKFPVSSLGYVGMKSVTAGHRTLGGTIVFGTLFSSAFSDLVFTDNSALARAYMPDAFPLFNIVLVKTNETGQMSYGVLYGVSFLDFGLNESVDNLVPMESYSYMALGFSPFRQLYMDTNLQKAPDSDQSSASLPVLLRGGR